MIFAIKLIIIHITLINVQFRHVDVDAEKAAKAASTEKMIREKIFRYQSIINWTNCLRKQRAIRNILGMFDRRDGDAV